MVAVVSGRIRRRAVVARAPVLLLPLLLPLLLLLLLQQPQQVNAGAYNPPLGEDARLDQIEDYPDWYEVDPLTLGAREYILDIRAEKGVHGLPKTMKVTLEPSGFIRIVSSSPPASPLFMGLWEPYTSLYKRTTTGFGMLFRRWKSECAQDMEYLFFKMQMRPPAFQPGCMSFKTGEIYDEAGARLGRFKTKLPHNKALIDSNFRAHRSWIKQRPW